MDQVKNYLQILEDSLNKKITVLSDLSSITDEQTQMLQLDTFDEDAFNDTVVRKAELIETLDRLDDGFQKLYNRVKEQLEQGREQYATEIQRLQTKIRMILDLSMKIERNESSNKNLVTAKFAALKKEVHQVRKSRDSATNYYKSMNRISEDPVFMDAKK